MDSFTIPNESATRLRAYCAWLQLPAERMRIVFGIWLITRNTIRR